MGDTANRVHVRTLGCKVNRSESEEIAAELSASGAETGGGAGADAVVVNTCTVTGEADAKSRKEVRRALAGCDGPVVVTGCMAALSREELLALGDRVVVEPDRSLVAERVRQVLGGTGPGPALGQASTGDPSPLRGFPGLQDSRRTSSGPAAAAARTRALVKVQDGCDDRCAYCIVPDARGPSGSVPADEVVARVDALVATGTFEVVLTGVNLGRYAEGSAGLAALVERVAATGVARIRLSSIEPGDLTRGLLNALAAVGCVAPHLHIPLQSGCDRTLSEMGRPYDTAAYAEALARARAAMPGMAVTTDVIAGFPGETDDEAAVTLAFVEACGFAGLHVFRYSARRGTPAAARRDQVPAPLRADRAAALRVLGERLAEAHAASRVGGEAQVLVERLDDPDAVGTSEDHLRVRVADCSAAPGSLVRVRVVSAQAAEVGAVPYAAEGTDT